MTYIIIAIWFLLGVCGYFMMRRGYKYDISRGIPESLCWEWEWGQVVLGIVCVLLGPIYIAIAYGINGNSCFKKWQNADNAKIGKDTFSEQEANR